MAGQENLSVAVSSEIGVPVWVPCKLTVWFAKAEHLVLSKMEKIMIGALAGAVCAFIPASLNAIPYGFTRAESVAASLNLFAILLMSFL